MNVNTIVKGVIKISYPFDCISDLIFVKTEIKDADIILVPGGSHPQLMDKAVELYNQGLAPYILPSGGANPKIPEYSSEWEFLKSIAVTLGMPEEKIKIVMGEVVKIGTYFEPYIKKFKDEEVILHVY